MTGVVRAAPPVKVAKPVAFKVEVTVTGAEKAAVAGTVSVWLLLLPSWTLPLATIAELAENEAVVVKLLAAATVRVCDPEVPSTVLPEAVRVLLVLARVTLLARVAMPELSIVRRSTS